MIFEHARQCKMKKILKINNERCKCIIEEKYNSMWIAIVTYNIFFLFNFSLSLDFFIFNLNFLY